MNKILAVMLLASCGNDHALVAPDASFDAAPDAYTFTWRDAEKMWSIGWCQYFEHCSPGDFFSYYGDQATCIEAVTQVNCIAIENIEPHKCSWIYPSDRLVRLEDCKNEMIAISCAAPHEPADCDYAFDRPTN